MLNAGNYDKSLVSGRFNKGHCMFLNWCRMGRVRGMLPVMLSTLFPLTAELRAEELDAATGQVASKVTDYLRRQDLSSIAISPFQGPVGALSSAGPGIVQAFKQHFERLGITVSPSASVGLQGRFHLDRREHQEGRAVLVIKGSLVDRFGETITDFTLSADGDSDGEFAARVSSVDDVAKTLGLTVSLHPEDSESDRKKDLLKSADRPVAHLSSNGLTAFTGADELYGIEFLVGDDPRPMSEREGRSFVSISRGETYAVRIINNTDHEAAIELTVDGINSFAFTQERQLSGPKARKPKYRYNIVPARSRSVVSGWHRSLQEVSRFQITQFSESAAAVLGHDGDQLGTVTVTFAAAWPKGSPPPRDEQLVERSLRDATGFGETLLQATRPVARDIGRLRGVVSIRYELLQALESNP